MYSYTFEVKNIGKTSVPSVKVIDDFPSSIEVVKAGEGTGWRCMQNGQKMSCIYPQVLEAGKTAPLITVKAKIRENTPSGTAIRNVAAVCISDPSKPVDDPSQCMPDRNECKPGDKDYNPITKTCDPATVIPKDGLKIKKYAGNKDGQISSDALQVNPGDNFTYTYRVTTSGNKPQTQVTVTDTFPLGVEVTGFKNIPANWTCNYGSKIVDGKKRSTTICQTPTMAAETTVDIIVNARMLTEIEKLVSAGTLTLGLRNIAYICSEETPGVNPSGNNPVCEPKCVDPNNPKCTPPVPPEECSPIPGHPLYDPACIIPSSGLDLAIKKYINTSDAQPGSPVTMNTNTEFDYILKVRVKSGTSTGVTTVKDVLPEGVKLNPNKKISGKNWNCSVNNKTIICTSTDKISAGNSFSDIVVPAIFTESGVSTEVRNDATVYNPNEENSCHNNNKEISGNEKTCEKDPDNTDPAVVKTPGGGGGNNSDPYATILCIQDLAVLKEYTSSTLCRVDWDAERDAAKKYAGGCVPTRSSDYHNLKNDATIRENIQKACTKKPTVPTGPGGGGG